MKLKRLLAVILMFSGLVFLFSGCASGQRGAIEIDAETGEIIE